jgi:c-di-GMP-binding flagellar brake protein YcgR
MEQQRPDAMDNVSVEINDLIQITRLSDEESSPYRSRVDDIVDGKLIIDWPSDAGIRMPIRKEQNVLVTFVRQDAVYSFEALVDECVGTPIPRVTLSPAGSTYRIQRRAFFRVRTSVPVQLTGAVEVSSASGEKKENVLHLVTHTVDLSGAGMAIYHKSTIPVGTVFDVKLTMEEGQAPLKLLARVVHTEALSRGSNIPIYHIGLYFLAVSEAQRTLIVRHCFRVQQKSLSQ